MSTLQRFLTERWPVLLAMTIVAYGMVLAVFSRAGFPESMDYGRGMPYLSDRPVGEDAYYALTVAWNIAEKGRIVYNLDKPTTGVQPLATFVYAAIACVVQSLGGDRWLLVRAVLVLNVLLVIAFAWLIGRIARPLIIEPGAQDLACALATVTTLSSIWIFRAFTYGLETGLYLVLVAAIVLATVRQDRDLHPVTLGLLAGTAGLARIDFGLIFALNLLWLIADRRLRLRDALATALIALLITTPWFLWVHARTGSWMPSSGRAQMGWISPNDVMLRTKGMAIALLANITPWISSWDIDIRFARAAVVLAGLLALPWPRLSVAARTATGVLNRPAVRQLAAWSACLAALVPVYFIGFWAWHFYGRYTAPLLVVSLPAIAVLATLAARSLKPLPTLMLALSPLLFVLSAAWQLHSGHMILDLPINAGFVRHQIGDTVLVGAAQSGTVGYFNQNVINLDGKIDAQALDSIRHRGIRTYIDAQRIEVLVDWPSVYRKFLFAGYAGNQWRPCRRQPGARSRCYVRRGSAP